MSPEKIIINIVHSQVEFNNLGLLSGRGEEVSGQQGEAGQMHKLCICV